MLPLALGLVALAKWIVDQRLHERWVGGWGRDSPRGSGWCRGAFCMGRRLRVLEYLLPWAVLGVQGSLAALALSRAVFFTPG